MLPFKRSPVKKWRVGIMPTERETALAIVHHGASDRPLLRHCAIHPAVEIRAEHILQPLNSNRELSHAAVSGVLGADDYQLIQLEAPDVPREELRDAVRWKLKDIIGYPVAEAVVDVFEVPESARYVETRMIFAVAARADAVQRVVNLVRPRVRGFDVIDIPEMCLRNVSARLPQDESGVALLVLGDTFVQLTLTCRGVLYLARRIETVRRLDLESTGSEPEIDAPALALELQRTLDHYESHFDLPAISEVVIPSSDPRAERLCHSLQSATGLSIAVVDVADLFEVAEGVEPDTRWPGLLALGAALRGYVRGAP